MEICIRVKFSAQIRHPIKIIRKINFIIRSRDRSSTPVIRQLQIRKNFIWICKFLFSRYRIIFRSRINNEPGPFPERGFLRKKSFPLPLLTSQIKQKFTNFTNWCIGRRKFRTWICLRRVDSTDVERKFGCESGRNDFATGRVRRTF